MIYLSSSCVKHKKISDSIRLLAEHGFKNIELSGGTDYYDEYVNDLLTLKKKYRLNYRIHNYFPPPKEHFVLNLASLNKTIFNKTIAHYKKSIDLTRKLDAEKLGIHAGFYIEPNVDELGQQVHKTKLYKKDDAVRTFINGYSQLRDYGNDIKIYIENNVISKDNFQIYEANPFMLTSFTDYKDLREKIEFPLLLDVAHLFVSCSTLNLNFRKELNKLIEQTDYIHISDNDGRTDSNKPINSKGKIFSELKYSKLSNKEITLEIYDDIWRLKEAYSLIANMEAFK